MKIRIIKDFMGISAGRHCDLPVANALHLIQSGLAVADENEGHSAPLKAKAEEVTTSKVKAPKSAPKTAKKGK